MGDMFGALTSLTGGGGLSGSSRATAQGGEIGGHKINFGGINKGASNQMFYVVGAVVAVYFLTMKKAK